ncbi:MAG: ATP-binding protein [Clostridium sp.]
MKRVMMNILSNAVKYNKENGQIYVSCVEIPSEQPEMTTMEFVCRDTGIGMAEEFQKHIFEPFAWNIREVAQSLRNRTGNGYFKEAGRGNGRNIAFESKGVGRHL